MGTYMASVTSEGARTFTNCLTILLSAHTIVFTVVVALI